MYYSCHCIKRNGLQHDCRRTGCGGEPACLVLPDPLCAPSQLARARGLADPAPLAAHYRAQAEGSGGPTDSGTGTGAGTGKRFIVCELKGIVPDTSTNRSGQCCKCPTPVNNNFDRSSHDGCLCPPKAAAVSETTTHCRCSCGCKQSPDSINPMLMFDEATYNTILSRFESKELAPSDVVIGPGGRPRKVKKTEVKKECTREGCVHWKPPPPCVWDAPCKADCFEAPPGIQPGRNPLSGSGGSKIPSASPADNSVKFVMLTPQ